jgi:hypothetical protein
METVSLTAVYHIQQKIEINIGMLVSCRYIIVHYKSYSSQEWQVSHRIGPFIAEQWCLLL